MSASNSRKICQVCAVDFTVYHFLLPLMRGMREAGHDVVAVCADGPLVGAVRDEGFRVYPIAFQRTLNLIAHFRAFLAFARFLRRERFDIVHAHTPVAGVIARVAAFCARVPLIVYTAHGFYFHENMTALKRWAAIAVEWFGGLFTDLMFTQSSEDAESARRLRLCRTGMIHAIGNGADPALFRPPENEDEKDSLRRRLDVSPDQVLVVTVGRLVREKGYPELIEAMRAVDAILLCVGDRLASDHAASIDDVLALAESDPVLYQRVRFLGRRDDVADILRASDVFVLASHREGMPRSIVEAMLTGLPVVATRIRGSREQVVDGVTGVLVPVGDAAAIAEALSGLVSDSATRCAQGEAALARARERFVEASVIEDQLRRMGLLEAVGS